MLFSLRLQITRLTYQFSSDLHRKGYISLTLLLDSILDLRILTGLFVKILYGDSPVVDQRKNNANTKEKNVKQIHIWKKF